MANKLTKREKYDIALGLAEVQANPILVEFFNAEKELLAKKNSGKRENATSKAYLEEVLGILTNSDKPLTASQIAKVMQTNHENEISNQRASAYLKQLVDNGSATKEKIKGVMYFKRA